MEISEESSLAKASMYTIQCAADRLGLPASSFAARTACTLFKGLIRPALLLRRDRSGTVLLPYAISIRSSEEAWFAETFINTIVRATDRFWLSAFSLAAVAAFALPKMFVAPALMWHRWTGKRTVRWKNAMTVRTSLVVVLAETLRNDARCATER